MVTLILMWILFGLLLLFGVPRFVYHVYSQGLYWERQNVPFVGRKFPYIFGNISHKPHRALQFTDFYKTHQTHPIIGIYIFLKPSVLVVDLQLIRRILIEDFQHFQSRGMYCNEKVDPLSAILGTLDHGKWKLFRSILTPAFTSAKLSQMSEILRTVGEKLIQDLNEIMANDNQLEIMDVFTKFTIEVIGKWAFGIDDSATTTTLREMMKKAKKQHLQFPWNIVTIEYQDFARLWGTRKHSKDVTDFFVNFVDEIIQLRKDNGQRRNDYMQLLIDSDLTVNEIAPLAYDLLSANNVDVTSTLAFCLYELSLEKNRHIQDRARTEIRTVLKHNNEITYDVLKELLYCDQIINETLRKHPLAGSATRITTSTFRVPNTDFTIPKGMRVFISIFAIHHDARYYPEPEEFHPERFSQPIPSGAFLPFGDGPRKCIGSRLARLLIGFGLVSLLQQFEFSTCDRTQIPIEYSSTKNILIPSKGVWLNVRRI